MSTITITIAADGTPSPSHIQVSEGDIVCYQAADDTVLCVVQESMFGSERFEIPRGSTICLLVHPNPPEEFQYLTFVGDLGERCGGGRGTGGSGGGSSGGGPG